MVIPRGRIYSLSPQHLEEVIIPRNDTEISEAMFVMDHGHVTSVLQEDNASIRNLLEVKKIHTLEMEAYHVIKKLTEMGYSGTINMVFTVSDIITSPQENITNPAERTQATAQAR